MSATPQTTNTGGTGTISGALQSITSKQITIPLIGTVSAAAAIGGGLLLYLVLFKRKSSGGVKVYA